MVGLLGSLWMAWKTPTFTLWVLSALCIVVVLVLTFVYFIPSNTAFANNAMELAQVTEKLNQWIHIHYFRIVFAMLSAVLGVIAVAK